MTKATTPDFTAAFQDMMAKFPMDMSAFQDAFKSSNALTEKMSAVALEAAAKSTEISSVWAKSTIEKATALSKVSADPADAGKAITDYASVSAEIAAENMAAFAEVAKKVQLDTVELMMNAGKDATAEATAAVKTATKNVTEAAKKAAA